MKQLLVILVTLFFLSCQQNNQEKLHVEIPRIKSAADNACIRCTEKIQAELVSCLARAKTPEQKSACNTKASNDWVSQCKALCNPKIDSSNQEVKGYGACTKCTCRSFREDASNGTCLNNRIPSTALCGHVYSDHK